MRQYFHALDRRKSTFLAQTQWKTKPFCFYPPSDMQLLIIDAANLPPLLEAIDGLHGSRSDTVISEAQEIRCRLLEMLKILCKWRSLHDINTKPPWFSNIMRANIHIHTLSFEIICLLEIEKVDVFLGGQGSTLTSAIGQALENDYSGRKTWELAEKICQSVEYFLQEDMKLFGPASAIFPLRIAYDVLSRDTQGKQEHRIRRCQVLFGRIRQTGISSIPSFPVSLAELD